MANLEVDLSNIQAGQTVTVKWRGKPVFIRHRTESDITAANDVDVSKLRDPQPDSARVKDPNVRPLGGGSGGVGVLGPRCAWWSVRRLAAPGMQLAGPSPSLPAPSSPPQWLIVLGVCTHLGCVPLNNAGDYNAWFCPCHGTHYDSSGRVRKGPAPYNLEVRAWGEGPVAAAAPRSLPACLAGDPVPWSSRSGAPCCSQAPTA